MAEIRALSSIREKWARVTPQRTDDYKLGVQNPRRDWEAGALSAKDVWKSAITEAAAKDMYGKGVASAGTAKWKDRAVKKGPARFAEGVMVGSQDYEKGFSPYHSVIEQTTLPPRMPRGDPRNIERVKTIATALRLKKVGA
jgi:hypothetical protein